MNKAKYPNRNALNQALDVYLDAMCQFVGECLDEQSIREALRLQSSDNLREEMEVKDIADLIKMRWLKSFKEKFKVVDREYIRYYDARSVASLIIEGRNQVSHQRLRELDPEFTRSQLFLIAEVLGKINRPDAQREVEIIRGNLFDDTTEQLVTTAVEAKETEYEKSIAEVKKRLAAEEATNKKLLEQLSDNAAKLDKKTAELETLSGQLVDMRVSKQEGEKQRNSISKQLKKVQTAYSACEERITTISEQLIAAEAERDDYKERFNTASKELEKAETEWLACEDSLTAMRKLFTVATIRDQTIQEIYPSIETDSTVRILDCRGVDKQNYLLNLLEQKQPTLIYVQSEEMVDLLLKRVVPEKADLIEKHGEQTSEAEEMEILERLENKELIAVVSNTTLSTLTSSHCIEHFVFCHLVPGLDEFFKQCESAFISGKNSYLHLIYNSEQDIKGLGERCPDREALEKLYSELRKLAGRNDSFIELENVYSELDIAKPSIEIGLAIFEELQLLERSDEGIKFLPPAGKTLDESEIYCRGEKLKKEIANFQAFQYEQSIEQIWEGILEKLGGDGEQILREVNTDEMYASVSEMGNDLQPTGTVENDSDPDAGDTEVNQAPKPPRANAKLPEEQVREIRSRSAAGESNSELAKEFNLSSTAIRFIAETTEGTRNEIAVKVVELRINATGSRPLAWRKIREELGLKNDQFHQVIRHSEGYREAVIERIKKLRAQDGGWEYSGKLEVLTGIDDLTEEELA